jgi:uncharacterized membrane protein
MLTWLFTKTPLFFFTQSFWRDEAFTYFLAKKNIFQIILLTAKDFNPPLYYIILHLWIKIFGSSEIALRSLSMMFYWATIYVIYLFLTDIFKFKSVKTYFYILLIIINPVLLYYAFEARMYTMFAFLSTLSFYAFLKKNYRLYFLSTVAGLFTHYFMIVAVLVQLIFALINKKRGFIFKQSVIFKSLLVFSPWFIYFLLQNTSKSFWVTKPDLINMLGFLGVLYSGNEISLKPDVFFNIVILSLTFLFIFSYGIYLYFKKPDKKNWLVFELFFIWGILTPLMIGLISFIKPIYLAKYLIFTTGGLLLFTIFILEKINPYLRILIFMILFVFTINYNQLQVNYRKKYNFISTFMEIKSISSKNDLVYLTSDLDFFTAEYYYDENRVYIYGKDYQEIPAYVGKVLIPKDKIAWNLPVYPRKAFIINSNNSYTIQAMY